MSSGHPATRALQLGTTINIERLRMALAQMVCTICPFHKWIAKTNIPKVTPWCCISPRVDCNFQTAAFGINAFSISRKEAVYRWLQRSSLLSQGHQVSAMVLSLETSGNHFSFLRVRCAYNMNCRKRFHPQHVQTDISGRSMSMRGIELDEDALATCTY